ncbi:MAG: VWA domain-containing protein [Bacteroidales bacterium]|nr:VWA domain-containing protein [Bacteroidales bacterium]MDY4174256.1 VWA domain-containing protein [Bacteroidales bacterium]
MQFQHPWLFLLLLVIPLYLAWYIWRRKTSHPTMQVSTLQPLEGTKPTLRVWLRHLPLALRLAAVALAIVVLARPQSTSSYSDSNTEGIDIVISLDISGSMEALDFRPNRLEAAKNVAVKFISGRQNDNIGLVIFAGESFTQCPLTTDHSVLINLFQDVRTQMLDGGTAIGMGLATAVSRIKESKAKSKVIILLTDGVNNSGAISPEKAAELAHTFGIRVYTIGVGTIGTAPFPVQTPFGVKTQEVEVKIDEPLLRNIAESTGGKYFRATDNKSLEAIYAEIDQLEKTIMEVRHYTQHTDEYFPFAVAILLLLLLEVVLRNTLLRTIP